MANKPFNPFENKKLEQESRQQQESLGQGELRPYLKEGFAEQHERPETMPLTYADPVPEATGQKNWEKLTPFEQKVAMWMPKAMGDATALATGWMSDDLKANLKAAWGPIGQVVSPVASTVGKALMLFALPAEGVERVWGLAQQYKDAAYHGTQDAFLKDLNSAWKAAHFKYETSGSPIPWIVDDGKGNLTVDFPLMGDMPGLEAQVKARQMFAAGATQEEVETVLEQDMGALQFRGMLNDVIAQSILDPLWLLGGIPGAVTKGRALLGGERAGYTLAEAAKAYKTAEEAAELARGAVKAAEAVEDLSGPLTRLKGAVEATKAGETLRAGSKISIDVINGLSRTDRAKLVEKGLLIFDNTTGLFRFADEGESVMKVLADAKDVKTLTAIADAEKEVARTKAGMEFAKAHQLKPIERKFLQLTGGVPGEDIGKSSLAITRGSLLKPWTWFRLTPEAKAQEVITMVGNNTASLIANLNKEDDILKTFLAAERGLASEEMGKLLFSIEGRAYTAMIHGASGVARDAIAGYAQAAVERGLLNNIADFLGRSADEIMEDLGQKNGAQKVYDAVIGMAKAPTAKGTAVTGLDDMMRAGSFTLETVDGIGKFFLDHKIPWNIDMLKLHISGGVADLARANGVALFGTRTEGVFTKATNALKAAETLAYLRLNPGYPIRNFLNNEVTMFARGVWSSMSEKDIHRLWTHIGYEPARLGEGIGSAGVKVGKEIAESAAKKAKINVSDAIREAEEMVAKAAKGDRNWMDKAAQSINGINLGKLDGGYWAQVCERMASRRAMTTGFMQGMHWYMKKSNIVMRPEEYFAKYHPQLDVSGIPQEVLERTYSGIRGALGEPDIAKLFKADLKMGFEDVVDEVAAKMGMTADDLRDRMGDEILERLRYDINRSIDTGDVDLLRRSFDNVSESLQDHLSGLAVNDFETYAERTASRIQATGDPTAYLRIYGDGIDGHWAAWEGYLSRLSERTRDIRALPMDKQGPAWDQFFRDSNGYFDRLFTRDEARIEGMFRAARNNGIHVPEDAIKPFRTLRDATAEFNKQKTRLYQAFRDKAPKLDDAERQKMWGRLQDELDQSYMQLMDVSDNAARDLDNVLVDAIRAQTPGYAPEIAAWRGTVRELRKGYQIDVRNHYRSIASLDGDARAAANEAFTAKRMDWQNRIHMAEREGIEAMSTGQPFGTVRGVDQETLNIYAKNMGVTDTFFEGKTLAERTQDYIAAGLSPKQARMMAAGDIRAGTGLTAGRVENRLMGQRAWVNKGLVPASAEGSAASIGLRDLEERGTAVTSSHIAGLSDPITNVSERVQWLENVVAEVADPNTRRAASEVLSREWQRMPKELFLAEDGPLVNGRWAMISAERGTPNRMATKRLEQELRDAGYTPISTRGTYTMEGVTSSEASFFVPGMSDREAAVFGKKYGQQSVMTKDGFIGTSGKNEGLFSRVSGVVEEPDLAKFGTEMDIGGGTVRFSMGTQMDEAGNIKFGERWVSSMDEPNGFITIERYMNPKGAKVLDPEDAAQRTGVATSGERGYPEIKFHGYYLRGTPPEGVVAQGRNRYLASIPSDKVYDLVRDPKGIIASARARKITAAGDDAGLKFLAEKGTLLDDDITRELVRQGYWAARNTRSDLPNAVRVFVPLEVLPEDQIGKRASMLMRNMEGQTIESKTVRDAVQKTFNLTENEADAVQAIVDARAKLWSRVSGRPSGEWYSRHIADVRYGLPPGFEGNRVYGELGRQFTGAEVADMLENTGILSDAYMAQLLGSEREMPEYLGHVVEHMTAMRQRAIEGGFTRRDVAKSYLLTEGSIRANAREVDGIAAKFAKAGLPWPPKMKGDVPLERYFNLNKEGKIVMRPEEFTAMWLMTESGQKALDALDTGLFRAELFDELLAWRKAAGYGADMYTKFNVFGATAKGKFNLSNIDEFLGVLNNKARLVGDDGKVTFDMAAMAEATQKLHGVGSGKEAFLRHFLGFGESPTIDTRVMQNWLEGSPIEDLYGKQALSAIQDRIVHNPKVADQFGKAVTDRLKDLRAAGYLGDLKDEDFMAVMHHWLWDRLEGTKTLHEGSYTTMRLGEAGDVEKIANWAAVTFGADGRAVLSALQQPDVSSVIHEIGHILRRDVGESQPELMRKFEKYLHIENGKWERHHEEIFARTFEGYLKKGIAPTEELKPLFARFKDWMEEIYKRLKWKRDLEPLMTDEVRGYFDEVFDVSRATGGQMSDHVKPGISSVRFDEMVREEPMIGQPLDELWWNDGGEILGNMRRSAEDAMGKVSLPGLGRAQAPDVKAAVEGYHAYAQGALKDANRFAIKYGTMKRDAALLNYKARTYFDQGLANAMPFGFWTTHSMAQWAKWSLERPAVISEWMRIKNFTETGGLNENLPQRLKGSVPITNLPFLPKWMGPLFVNPTRAMNLPFDMWVNPIEQGNQAGKAMLERTTQLIQRGMEEGTIDPKSGQQAIAMHSGPVWQDAMAEVSKGGEDTYDPFDALSSLLAPHAPLVWAYHAARGTTDEIGPFLPATRTVKAATALMGIPGGLNIEGPLRKAMGLPEFDKWDEYRTERMLVNMVANQEISIDDAQAAWQTKEGEIWTEAKTRAGKEFAVGAFAGMIGIPSKAYPEGEQFSRELQTGLNKAYDNGTEREFFEAHPEVKMRLALFDTPEERFKTFVTDKVWDTYNNLPSLSKSTARDILGEDFEAFLAGDVPAKSLDTDKAAVWLKTMGFADSNGLFTGEASALTGTKTLKDGTTVPLRMPPPEIAKQAQSYYDLRAQKFSPIIFEYQDEYFKLKEGAERKQYATKHPGLRAYWDWREQWFLRHPEVAPYITEKPPGLTNKQLEQAQGRPVNLSAQEWEQVLGGHIYALVMDTKNGHELPDVVVTVLQQKAEQYGLTGEYEHGIEEMMELILTAPQ